MPLMISLLAPRAEPLTARELRILVLLAAGRSPDEIAACLATSPASLRAEVTAVYRKTGADGRLRANRRRLRRRGLQRALDALRLRTTNG